MHRRGGKWWVWSLETLAILAVLSASGCKQVSDDDSDADGGIGGNAGNGNGNGNDGGAATNGGNAEATTACNQLIGASVDLIINHCEGASEADRESITAQIEAALPAPCAEADQVRDATAFTHECLPQIQAIEVCPTTSDWLPDACRDQILYQSETPPTTGGGDGTGVESAVTACNRVVDALTDLIIAEACQGATEEQRAAVRDGIESQFPGGCAEADAVRDAASFSSDCLPGIAALEACPTSENLPDTCRDQIQFRQ